MSKAEAELFKLLNTDGFYDRLPYVRDRDVENVGFMDAENIHMLFLKASSEVFWCLCKVCGTLKPKVECKSVLHRHLGKEKRYIVCKECLKEWRSKDEKSA